MKPARSLRRAPLAACAAAFLASIAAHAQLTTATLYGIITDPTGAVIPGAVVTLTNQGTNASQSRVSDAAGEVAFEFQRVGLYTVRVEAKGFKTLQAKGFQLLAGQNVRRTFALELGAVSETVAVEGVTPLVNTVSTEQMESFSKLEVTELPLARRDFSHLLLVGTGVTSSNGGSSIRLNGTGNNGANYTVDGTDANANSDARSASMYGGFNYVDLVSVEAIQEVQTVKGVIPAEYGQTLGGYVNVVTKSGTNQWHGTAFENFQADNLNARSQFLSTKPGTTFNQFGGSMGGPIRKDRIFIFGTYEGYRQASFRQVDGNVPTPELRDQMLAANPSYKLALDIVPLPNQPYTLGSNSGFYLGAGSFRASDNHAVIKSDMRLTDRSNLSLTYSRGRPFQLIPSIYINGANDRTFNGWQERGTASFVTGSARWTSETRFGYNLADMARLDKFFDQGRDPNQTEQTDYGRRIGLISTDLGWSTASDELWQLDGTSWSLEEKVARYAGPHSFKFGGKFVHHSGFRTNPQNPEFHYQSAADLLANVPSQVTASFGSGIYRDRMYEFGFFAQDDWRVNRRLVLNLGVRYDYFSNLVARSTGKTDSAFYNLDGLLDSQFHFGPYRDPNDPYNPDGWINLSPRIGFSYNPDGQAKMVIRGGFGVIFAPQLEGAMRQSVASKTVPFRSIFSKQEAAAYNLGWPLYNDNLRAVVEQQAAKTGQINLFSVFNPNLQNPYTLNYSLGVERQIGQTLMFETAYVGNRGVKFPLYRWFNQADRVTGVRPNPGIGQGYYVDNTQTTEYNSWQTSLRKRYSKHLTGAIHYTWSKALATSGGDIGAYYQGDNTSVIQDFFNPRADRGLAPGDIAHYFAAEWVYDLPTLSGMSPALRQVAGGWQVSGVFTANTGGPLIITQSSSIQNSRPDYAGGAAVNANYTSTLQYLNKAAFQKVPVSQLTGETLRPGNAGVGMIRAPGQWNVDASLGKSFFFTERLKLQFRAEAFNFFNHTNLTRVSTNINSGNFGRLQGTTGARLVQLNARLSW